MWPRGVTILCTLLVDGKSHKIKHHTKKTHSARSGVAMKGENERDTEKERERGKKLRSENCVFIELREKDATAAVSNKKWREEVCDKRNEMRKTATKIDRANDDNPYKIESQFLQFGFLAG